MRPAYKQHVREFVKDGRATLVNHSLDEGLRLKDARNRPSGNPNCGLFPQGPIIPVPPSSSPYRPVGICGNNWAVSPDRHAKESLRTRGFGGSYSRYFAGGFALWRRRNSTRRYSAHQNASSEASFRYSHSMASVPPSRHSSCAQFSVPPRAECRQVTPCRASSASGTKVGTTSKTFSNSGL